MVGFNNKCELLQPDIYDDEKTFVCSDPCYGFGIELCGTGLCDKCESQRSSRRVEGKPF